MKGDIQLEYDFVPSFLNLDIQRESKEERELKKSKYVTPKFIEEISEKFNSAIEKDIKNANLQST